MSELSYESLRQQLLVKVEQLYLGRINPAPIAQQHELLVLYRELVHPYVGMTVICLDESVRTIEEIGDPVMEENHLTVPMRLSSDPAQKILIDIKKVAPKSPDLDAIQKHLDDCVEPDWQEFQQVIDYARRLDKEFRELHSFTHEPHVFDPECRLCVENDEKLRSSPS